jgi:histone arginine demethylase JMJD6
MGIVFGAEADRSDASPRVGRSDAHRGAGIDRRAGLSVRELVEEYVIPERPVIVTDAAADWPAMRSFTFDFFRERYGHLVKKVRGTDYTLAEAIDLIQESSPERPAPYPFNFNVESYFPELLDEMKPDLAFGRLDRVNHPLLPRIMLRGTEIYELFFGGRGAAFPRVHYDALCLNTQITQIVGSKEFFLYPPEQGCYMYPRPDDPKTSLVDFAAPDLDKFPLFARATPVVATVEQGETIFFPARWWHSTRIHEPCISLGKVQLNGQNWNIYADDVESFWKGGHPWFARAARAYLSVLGQVMKVQERLQ